MSEEGKRRGGVRVPGPGKKLGRPVGSGSGRRVEARQVTMEGPLWALLDRLKGSGSRGALVARLLRGEEKRQARTT